MQETSCIKPGTFFLQKFEKCWNVIFGPVECWDSRLQDSRASPAQKSRGLKVVYSKNFSRATFFFSGSLSWLMYIWDIYPWNKFDEKAQCEILIMTAPCCNKVLVFMLVSILLLIECTNLAKANNQADSYEYYPDYHYPDQNSKNNLFSCLCRLILSLEGL